MGAIRILGIDPGLGVTGYGVVEKRGAVLAYIASGRIVSDQRQDLSQRLSTILQGLGEVIDSYHPGEVAGEDAQRMQKLVDALEALDDVQEVYTTAALG